MKAVCARESVSSRDRARLVAVGLEGPLRILSLFIYFFFFYYSRHYTEKYFVKKKKNWKYPSHFSSLGDRLQSAALDIPRTFCFFEQHKIFLRQIHSRRFVLFFLTKTKSRVWLKNSNKKRFNHRVGLEVVIASFYCLSLQEEEEEWSRHARLTQSYFFVYLCPFDLGGEKGRGLAFNITGMSCPCDPCGPITDAGL